MNKILTAIVVVLIAAVSTDAFVVAPRATTVQKQSSSASFVFGKKPKEDLSFIESRDMTRDEMLELNKKNEDIMNMELQMMTLFSLLISLPILYLCWVAFFSD